MPEDDDEDEEHWAGAKQGEKGPTVVEQIGTGLVKFEIRYESYSSPLADGEIRFQTSAQSIAPAGTAVVSGI